MFWLYILIFIVSCLILIRSGTLMVGALTRIAQFLEWREFTVAFFLMAFATSVPELFVGITSALHLKSALSFGNIIGSNVINLTLAIAVAVLLANGLSVETVLAQRNSVYVSVIASLPILLMLDGMLSRVDGLALLLVLVFYFQTMASEEKRFTRVISKEYKREWPKFKLFLKDLGIFLGGVLLLLLAAQGIVLTSFFFAEAAGLSLAIIGILIVSLGTNLPEIAFGVKAIALGHKEMVLGNLMGSVVANSTLVLGLTILISPLEIPEFSPYITGIIFTVLASLFFVIFSKTGKKITRKEALFLLGIYILFVVLGILMK